VANKKRKRPRTGPGPATPGGANLARRERKEEARAAREAERRRAARRGTTRRLLTFGAIGVAGFVAIYLVGRAASPGELTETALAAASSAGCGELERPAAGNPPGGDHLGEGETFTYADVPATSGRHAPSPLPLTPRVYGQPVDETQAVHTLEHGSVIVYYRPPGDAGVSQGVIDRLSTVVEGEKASYLIPYPGLPEGQGLAYTAWNKRMFCPPAITPDDAAAIAEGFAAAWACTSNAPEPNNGDGC
jgi:hypothetical protein